MTNPRFTVTSLRLAIALLLLGLGASHAQNLLYTPGSSITWRDNANAANGCYFTVGSTNIIVSHLGYFSTNGPSNPVRAGLARDHYVGICVGNLTTPTVLRQVDVPAGTAGYYYGTYWWVQLDPPMVLTANTGYILAGQGYNVDGDWWEDNTTGSGTAGLCNWNAYFVGTQGSGTRYGLYGPSSTTWPATGFTKNGNSKAYDQGMLGNLPVGPAKIAYIGPTSLMVTGLQSFTLSAYTAGQTPITGQWWQNGTAIPGATTTVYTVPSAWDTNSGIYYFTATNTISGVDYGEQTPNISVAVYTYPGNLTFTPSTFGQTETLFTGANANFALTSIAGLGSMSYYWYTNGTADDTATGTVAYSLANVQAASCPTNLSLVITNTIGAVTNTWLISVVDPPTQPYPATVLADSPIGYWRLNEADNTLGNGNYNAVANDYWRGNCGDYTNTVLSQTGYGSGLASQFGYTPATDPETSAQFGNSPSSGSINGCAFNIPNVTFAAANGNSAAFSVEAWVKGGVQTYDAGIVTIGYGGAEQFNLDTGSDSGGTHKFRFYFRDAASTTHGSSTSVLPDGNWHHLVGVVDEVHSNVVLYVDSVPQNPATCNSGIGVLAANTPMSIGARRSSSTTNYNYQFLGNINDVAVYNYALTSLQVSNHYTIAGIGAHCFTPPVAATNINQGADLIVPALVIGTAPFGCQWYNVTAGFTPLANETNATLVISNIQAADFNAHTLALVSTNAYGQATNQTAVTVYTTPVFTVQPTNYFTLYAGGSASGWNVSVATIGPPPIGYNWLSNGVPIAFATNATFTITGLLGSTTTYSCWASNVLGSATGGVVIVTILAPPSAAYPAAVLADSPLGYWRLNETNNGTGNTGALANDYWGGNYGFYTNTILGQAGYSQALSNQFGYYPATDPTESSAQFGYYTAVKATSNLVANIPNINFAKTNASATFSIEAWANGDAGQQGLNINGGGIVAKGAWALEQFTLDTGGGNQSYRFTTRDAVNTIRTANTSTNVPDGKWHHLVGVLDEVHSNLCLYVDGLQVAITPMPTATNGVLGSATPVSIGSRLGSGGAYSQQFFGNVNDVAIYSYALSSTQVVSHYLAAGIGPRFTLQPPATTNVNEGTTLAIPTQVIGSAALKYQWYDLTNAAAMPNQTNATLVISNISQATYNNHAFYLAVSNTYSAATSSIVALTVQSGPPNTVVITPANPPAMYVGLPLTLTATALGTQPFGFIWSLDGGPIAGASSSAYTYTNLLNAHTIQCIVTNTVGRATNQVSVFGQAVPADTYGQAVLGDQPVAFYRLDEASGAGTATDYVGGHNGTYYNAVNGLPGFNPNLPAETTAEFGLNGATTSLAYENDESGSGIPNLDFSKPQGVNAEFSTEGWINAPAGQANSSPMVAKGYGNGGEQYDIEVYGGHFRFFYRTAANATRIVTSPNIGPDGTWHHVVGVCDEANGVMKLYIDGVLNATTATAPLEGLLAGNAILTSIGARTSSSSDQNFSYQLSNGNVAQVALYNYALTSGQVAAHYLAAAEPPTIYVQPSPVTWTRYQGPSFQYSVGASGSPTLAYQWYQNGAPASGATTNSLSFASIQPTDSGSYTVVVTNSWGSTTSSVVTLTVLGANTAYEGQILPDNPIAYWRFNETSGTTAYDYIGGFNGTFGASVSLGVAGPSSPDFTGFESTNVAIGMGSQNAGAAAFATVPALGLNTNTVTITCWVYPYADITNYSGLVYSRASTYAKGISYIGLNTSRFNTVGYTWNQNNINTYGWPSGLVTPPGQWSFVALTIAPTRAIMYVGNNGVVQAATNAIAHDVEAFNGITAIAADSSSNSRILDGAVDEVAFYGYTLSADQISALYSAATAPASITLTIQPSGSDILLSWPQGTLLAAPTLDGPWTNVPNANAPSFTTSPTENQLFYRVRYP